MLLPEFKLDRNSLLKHLKLIQLNALEEVKIEFPGVVSYHAFYESLRLRVIEYIEFQTADIFSACSINKRRTCS